MHEEQNPKEYVFEKIKIDDIKGEFLIEYKKTSSNIEGTRMEANPAARTCKKHLNS